ncbi:Rpn family recombination-promoting nuclease/putative transposase [Scytonema sp. UIC 10036]|uniref:Rpn family recombination-promoting nuclease/putative transposase n=1 Tax=Scytonema sp. UIC 10036 TaxID=2304196 RepID=UPI0012DA631D|nr:Rpn family recombination-promoting nuclease/putative transposase [Scytonema sp. UIC 10036]MUG94710.1 Rpn family recombination-promoting nuclease/putative transposase [Scytonema sp. UIC 10036]
MDKSGFRLDGLLSTPDTYPMEPIYFIEAQSYKDDNFYNQFVAKVILYLTQYQPPNKEWYAVVIYNTKSNEGTFPEYLSFFKAHLRCFYLDELAKTPNQLLAVGVMRLIVEKKTPSKTGELARQLMSQAQQELTNAILKEKVLEFIQTVVIDKFTNLSREEIAAMLGLESLKNTRVYQEAKLEGIQEGIQRNKIEMIPILLELGLTIEQTAERLKLDVETVRKNAQQ